MTPIEDDVKLYGQYALMDHMRLHTVGLEEGRNTLPQLATRAHAGEASVLTRHGKPYAAIVSVDVALKSSRPRTAFLALKGSGKGLWGTAAGAHIAELRDEWS